MLFVTAAAAQPPQMVQPGRPGEASKVLTAPPAHTIKHSPADTAFMQGMIGHHAQALEMTELLKTRSQNEGMKKLALRIDVSQADEIQMMKTWLKARGEALPDEHAHHMHGAKLMPGMLTPEEMAKLAAASGEAFDKLFLEYMIKHHQGAIAMVDELFAQRGAAQESEIYAFATDVVADQQMEISRMRAMLGGR